MLRAVTFTALLAATLMAALPAAAFSFDLPYLTFPDTRTDAAGSTGR